MAIIQYRDENGTLVSVGAGKHTHSPSSIGAAEANHPHDVATTSSDGFLSAQDKVKIDSLNAKVFGDSASNTKGLVDLVGNTAVSEQISSAVANKVEKDGNKVLSTNDYTTPEKNKLAGIATGAEVNQNAFSNITVGSTTIAADQKSDTLIIAAGSNITLTPDATTDKITIAATNTTYSGATQSAAGLLSAADKKKLDGIAEGATKIAVDSALNATSTNPIQNKVVYNIDSKVGVQPVSEQISAHAAVTATQSTIGHMSAADKKKLDGIAEGAQVNQNAFGKVNITSPQIEGQLAPPMTSITAQSNTDALTFVAGDGVSITSGSGVSQIVFSTPYKFNVVRDSNYTPDSSVANNVITIVLPSE